MECYAAVRQRAAHQRSHDACAAAIALSRLSSLPAVFDIPKGFTPRSVHCQPPSRREMTDAINLPFRRPCQQSSLRSSHASGTSPPETVSPTVCTDYSLRSAGAGNAHLDTYLPASRPKDWAYSCEINSAYNRDRGIGGHDPNGRGGVASSPDDGNSRDGDSVAGHRSRSPVRHRPAPRRSPPNKSHCCSRSRQHRSYGGNWVMTV